jgi:hypothetical protein
MKRLMSAEKLIADDFGVRFTKMPGEVVYDALSVYGGGWATMTEQSFQQHSLRKLGAGFGHKYIRQSNGELHKDEST